MPKDVAMIRERIKNGQCPICGEELKSQATTLVIDAKFGDLYVCSRHIVQGDNKLAE
jgi:hypothetical protein